MQQDFVTPAIPKNSANPSYAPQSRFVEVNSARMHYLEYGSGKPILFIHGMPSCLHLWRNIMPHLCEHGRCIAVDLIGHGDSDSPQIDFSVKEHLAFLTGFIEKLGLEDITIIGHSWGATLGIAYARTHEKNVRALSYFEPMLGAWNKWEDFNPSSPQAQEMFKKFRSEEGKNLIIEQKFFLEQIFVNGSIRKLTPAEKEGYIGPFRSKERRKAAWKAPQELPIAGSPIEVIELVEENFRWQKQTHLPQLFFYTNPSAFFTIEKAKKFAQSASRVTLCYLGKGVYNHAEDYPHEIGNGFARWLINNYALDKGVPKFSFYTNIHKAIRKEIFETCLLAGTTDFTDRASSNTLANKFNSLLTLLRNHSKHEDTFIHPLLLEKGLTDVNTLNSEHQELEEQLVRLEQLFVAHDKSSCLESGNNFYLALSEFASVYLKHLIFEETKIMPSLKEAYDQSSLVTVMDRFKRSQSPEEAMQSLSIMLSAVNPDEALFMLTNIQKTVPHESFIQVCHLAKTVMPEDQWEKIDAQLCLHDRKLAASLQDFSSILVSTRRSAGVASASVAPTALVPDLRK